MFYWKWLERGKHSERIWRKKKIFGPGILYMNKATERKSGHGQPILECTEGNIYNVEGSLCSHMDNPDTHKSLIAKRQK